MNLKQETVIGFSEPFINDDKLSENFFDNDPFPSKIGGIPV